MITIGIDASLTGTGFVSLKDGKMINKKLITSKPCGPKPIDELMRLRKIVDAIESEIRDVQLEHGDIELAAIEGMAFMAKGTSLVQLSGLNYFIRDSLRKHDIPFIIVAPTSLKKFSTSKGNAQKDLMMLETYKRWGVSIPENNTCDAYCLSRVAEGMCGDPKLNKLQQEVIDLLNKQYDSKN